MNRGRETHVPGVGFPQRLRTLLRTRNLRAADFERAGIVKSDAISRWMRGEAHPDKTNYYQVCKFLRLGSTEALALLKQPGEPLHVLPTRANKLLLRFSGDCDTMEALLPLLDGEGLDRLAERLRALLRAVRARKETWTDSTTTESDS